jgi:predicted transcriptional regulator
MGIFLRRSSLTTARAVDTFYEGIRNYLRWSDQPNPHVGGKVAVKEPVFTGRELDIMSVLWRQGSGSVAEVRKALGDSVAYTTVLKILQILEDKGAVRHEAEGRAYRYYPLVEPSEAGGTALSKILEKIFDGSAELLLAQLVSDQQIGSEELGRMRKLLEEMEDEGGDP